MSFGSTPESGVLRVDWVPDLEDPGRELTSSTGASSGEGTLVLAPDSELLPVRRTPMGSATASSMAASAGTLIWVDGGAAEAESEASSSLRGSAVAAAGRSPTFLLSSPLACLALAENRWMPTADTATRLPTSRTTASKPFFEIAVMRGAATSARPSSPGNGEMPAPCCGSLSGSGPGAFVWRSAFMVLLPLNPGVVRLDRP